MINTSSVKPEIYRKVEAFLPGADWEAGLAITFGDVVYSKYPLHPAVQVHELVHVDQQTRRNLSPEEWWNLYFHNKLFRFEQELEAYKEQVKFIRASIKDRNQRFSVIHLLAIDMSGPMYGKMCSYSEALTLLN